MRASDVPSMLTLVRQRVTPRQVDWLAFAAALAVALLKVTREASDAQVAPSLVVVPFATLPLLWRRRHPGAVLLVLAAAFAASCVVAQAAPSNVGVLFALYAAARYGEGRVRLLSCIAAALLTVTPVAMLVMTGSARISHRLTIGLAVGMGAAWLLGEATRSHRAYSKAIEHRFMRLTRERDEHIRRVAERERTRIARELHDVVTHKVTVIAVHASAAYTTSDSHPARPLEALQLIQQTARETLGELRSLLGVLRTSDPHEVRAPLSPPPSIDQLGELVGQTRAAGVEVTVQVLGTPVTLNASSDLAAYRVVQEALTNVVRHAPHATAQVDVRYEARQLRISVCSDGGQANTAKVAGYGLIGLRERVQLIGGELHTGPTARDTFSVEARIPFGVTEEATVAELSRPVETAHDDASEAAWCKPERITEPTDAPAVGRPGRLNT